MSTTIAFHKIYTRHSKSPWADKARVVMLFEPQSKGGIYLHLGGTIQTLTGSKAGGNLVDPQTHFKNNPKP